MEKMVLKRKGIPMKRNRVTFFSEKKMWMLCVCFLAVSSIAGLASADLYDARDIALTPGDDIAELHFNWYSSSSTDGLVQVAPTSNMSGNRFPTSSILSDDANITSVSSGNYSNKAVIDNLKPSTNYVYRLGDGDGNWSKNYYFTTHREDRFSFLALSDPQIGVSNTGNEAKKWASVLNSAAAAFPEAAFILSAGDQVNTNNDESKYRAFLSPNELRSIPLAPAVGNHDEGAYNYSYHFSLPNLSTNYGETNPGSANYYFTYGDALFMVLNTNNSDASDHEAFIAQTIRNNDDAQWKIVMFHHDIYGSGRHATSRPVKQLRRDLFPIFDSHHIDIVITGHDHSFTRTYVMRNNTPQENITDSSDVKVTNPDGTVYFTLSTASGSKYYALWGRHNYDAVKMQPGLPMVSNVEINGNKLTFKTYIVDGSVLEEVDSIVIEKR